ncbi:hypothetical protein BGX24_012645 [Mortierella sp. AD032]|nr:hypothetical protein BGX24_012645 [Mortierella sp. AD032]
MHRVANYTESVRVPLKGHVTIGESNSALVHVYGPEDPKLQQFIKKHGELKAAVKMPSRNANIPQHNKVSDSVEEFLEDALATASGIIPQPILDKIEELSKQWDMEDITNAAGAVMKKAWDIYNAFAGSYNTIVRHDKLAKLLIRKVAWHPHQPLLAIALWNDSVWVYDLSVESWYSCGLSHTAQKKVSSLEWKPMSGVVLAIGCKDGVALWNVYRDHTPARPDSAAWATEINPAKDRPSELLSRAFSSSTAADNHGNDTAWVGINYFKDLRGVDQMAWDPRGELLAIGSAQSSTVYIRESGTKRVTELRLNLRFTPPKFIRSVESFMETVSNIKDALGTVMSPNLHKAPKPVHEEGHFGPTVCCLKWSPSGEYLLVAHQSEVVRIYTVATWDYIQIKDLKGAIQSACWTPDSHNILYALQGDDLVRALHLEKRGGELNWIPLNHARLSLEYTQVSSKEDKKSASKERFGGRTLSEMSEFGPIEELVLDPNGERMIVRFRDTDLLGVVLVRPTGAMLRDLDIFLLTGLIQGPGWNGDEDEEDEESRGREPKACTMSFTNHFRGGSLLTVAWESGRVNFIPFYYLSQKEVDAF